MMRLAPLTVALAACTADASPAGRVVVALGEDVCADYCLAAMRATLYAEGDRVLPLGPAQQVECGAALTFEALPAGERVVVSVEGFDVTGERLLAGDSEPITVIADDVARATVKLAALAPPVIDTVTPDPVAAGAELTLRGAFDAALGEAAVELGGASFDASALHWTLGDGGGDAITLTLPDDARGGDLIVRRCGVASAPWDLRVYGATLGEAAVGAPLCGGGGGTGAATARAAAVDGDDVLVAWSCAGGSGAVSHLRSGDALCPLDPGLAWSVAGTPTGVALPIDGRGLVANADGVWSFALDSAAAPTLLFAGDVRAVAATDAIVYAVDGGHLVTADGPVAGVDASLVVGALAADGAMLYAAAATASGEGRLLIVGAGPPRAISLVVGAGAGARSCLRPGAIALTGGRAALACADGGVVVWDGSALTGLEVTDAIGALAWEDRGDVLFALGGDALVMLGGAAPVAFARAAGEAPLLVAVGGHRLLVSGASGLVVATPFSTAGPCAEAGP